MIWQTGETITDQIDLLREQIKMLTGDVALNTSSLKRMLKEAARNPDDSALQVVSHDGISVEFLSFYMAHFFFN